MNFINKILSKFKKPEKRQSQKSRLAKLFEESGEEYLNVPDRE